MKRLLLLGLVGLALLVAVIVLVSRTQSMRLVSSQPKDGAVNVEPPAEIVLVFNRELAPAAPLGTENATTNLLKIAPPATGSIRVEGKRLTFTPTSRLEAGQRYVLRLTEVRAKTGQAGPSVGLSFSIQAAFYDERRAQFIASLPYNGDRFSIDYNQLGDFFSVSVLEDPAEAVKEEALQFLSSHGVTPANAEISFYLIPGVGGSSGLAP